jgi:hypothetical protein
MLADSLSWQIAWDEMSPEENIEASIAYYNGSEKMMCDLIFKLLKAYNSDEKNPHQVRLSAEASERYDKAIEDFEINRDKYKMYDSVEEFMKDLGF